MTIDWPQVGTMLFGAFLTLLGTTIAGIVRSVVSDRKTKNHVKRRLGTQMAGLIRTLRTIEGNGHKETKFFSFLMSDLREWREQLLQDRSEFSHFKELQFERAVIDWHQNVGRLIVVSDGIDAGGRAMVEEGRDPTERLIAWREGLVERLAEQATVGDKLLEDLERQ